MICAQHGRPQRLRAAANIRQALTAYLSIPATAQQVSAASVDFPRVARSLEPGFYAEAGAFHGLRDVRHLQEAEVDVYVLAPPLVQVPDLGTTWKETSTSPSGRSTRQISAKAGASSPGSRWMIE